MKHPKTNPQVYNVFSEQDVDYMIKLRHDYQLKEKMSGLKNWQYKGKDEIVSFVLDKLKPMLGDDVVRHGGNYFAPVNPFHPHTDTGKVEELEGRQPYKNIVIPLTENPNIHTVVFNQRWYGEATHFWQGSLFSYLPDPLYNSRATNLDGVEGATDKDFDVENYLKYLTHLPYEALHGFTMEGAYAWKLGEVLTFDCSMIHCASNFRAHGIQDKLGLSMFVSKHVEEI